MANALKTLGVHKGDRVTIYLPMILEGVVAMLACARLGEGRFHLGMALAGWEERGGEA